MDIKDIDINNIKFDIDPKTIDLLRNRIVSSNYPNPDNILIKYIDTNTIRPLIVNLVNVKSTRNDTEYRGCARIKFRFNLADPTLKDLRQLLFDYLPKKLYNDVSSKYNKEANESSTNRLINIENYEIRQYDLYVTSYEFLNISFPVGSVYDRNGNIIYHTNNSSVLDMTIDLSNIHVYTTSNRYSLDIEGKKAIFYSKTTKRNNLPSEEYQARLLKLNII
jgi:hypothetical protein